MSIGENIKSLRKQNNLTQKRLGELCKPPISESTIRKYELGLLNPKIQTIEKIAKALNIDSGSLIHGFNYYDPTNIGEVVKNNRKNLGISQEQLAQMTGCDLKTIQHYESGKFQPTIEQIIKIGNVLGIAISDLYNFRVLSKADMEAFQNARDVAYTDLSDNLEFHKYLIRETIDCWNATVSDCIDLNSIALVFLRLNEEGKDECVKRVSELFEISKYKRNFD